MRLESCLRINPRGFPPGAAEGELAGLPVPVLRSRGGAGKPKVRPVTVKGVGKSWGRERGEWWAGP